ncbi:MAG: hypothetical protein EPN88_13795 [Bacteroidetes bacterium]|nr:MAG: hypothetical protein EPN88_13795 [Bacteroidota bacterium]
MNLKTAKRIRKEIYGRTLQPKIGEREYSYEEHVFESKDEDGKPTGKFFKTVTQVNSGIRAKYLLAKKGRG